MCVAGQRVDQLDPGGLVVVVTGRLARGGVIVVAGKHRPQFGRQITVGDLSRPRIAERTSVTVSIVATASYSGVESSTRLRPTNPACLAASSVTSKIRSGPAERASLARMSTSTVCANPG